MTTLEITPTPSTLPQPIPEPQRLIDDECVRRMREQAYANTDVFYSCLEALVSIPSPRNTADQLIAIPQFLANAELMTKAMQAVTENARIDISMDEDSGIPHVRDYVCQCVAIMRRMKARATSEVKREAKHDGSLVPGESIMFTKPAYFKMLRAYDAVGSWVSYAVNGEQCVPLSRLHDVNAELDRGFLPPEEAESEARYAELHLRHAGA